MPRQAEMAACEGVRMEEAGGGLRDRGYLTHLVIRLVGQILHSVREEHTFDFRTAIGAE